MRKKLVKPENCVKVVQMRGKEIKELKTGFSSLRVAVLAAPGLAQSRQVPIEDVAYFCGENKLDPLSLLYPVRA